MKTPRIVVVGSVNADMVVKGRQLPRPGETVVGGTFLMAAGGKGANQAVAAARLGAEVSFVAKVGQDLFGEQAIENYRKEGIRTDLILRDPQHATGVALILVDEKAENMISVASGANHALTPQEVEQAADRIRDADVLMVQLEIPLETVCAAVGVAAQAGVPVILNPAPAAQLPPELLAQVTYLTPNESEAQQLAGVAVVDEASARQAASRLLSQGVRHVLITLGDKGALVASQDAVEMVRTVSVRALDTTAAGDAFNGGLAWAIGRGLRLQEAVRQACLVGALSVTRMGAQPSLPTLAELQQFAATTS